MFIKAIIVPVLIICLLLFAGVNYNNANMDDNNGYMSNYNNVYDENDKVNLNSKDLTTTPITLNNNDTTDSFNYSMLESQIRNELERINGLGRVYVRLVNNTAYIIKNDENSLNLSMIFGTATIKDEIIRTIKNLSQSINRICIINESDVYGDYKNNANLDLSIYENKNNTIELY